MHRHLLIWILLFCCLGVNAQQQQDTAFRKLYQHYFKLYNTPEKEKEFWETSEKLKAYYKAQDGNVPTIRCVKMKYSI